MNFQRLTIVFFKKADKGSLLLSSLSLSFFCFLTSCSFFWFRRSPARTADAALVFFLRDFFAKKSSKSDILHAFRQYCANRNQVLKISVFKVLAQCVGFSTVDLYALVDKCFIYTRGSPWAAALRFFTPVFSCLFMRKNFAQQKI